MYLFGENIIFIWSELHKKQISVLKYQSESCNFTLIDLVNYNLALHNQRAALKYCASELGHVVTQCNKYEKLG